MTKIGPERAALIERIKVVAEALELPKNDVDDVIRHGTSYHRGKAVSVLCEFALKHGVSLDWLITGELEVLIKYAAIGYRVSRARAA